MTAFSSEVAANFAASPARARDIALLRDDLLRAQYTDAAVRRLLGATTAQFLERGIVAPARRRCQELLRTSTPASSASLTQADTPSVEQVSEQQRALAVVVLLWRVRATLSEEQLTFAFPQLGRSGLQRLNLIAAVAEEPVAAQTEATQKVTANWRATCALEPLPETTISVGDPVDSALVAGEVESTPAWVCADYSASVTGEPIGADHVLGIGGATRSLLKWTSRREVKHALDLGTGCGVQALAVAQHARHVVATDISDAALATASFAFALADTRTEFELRGGSLYEPVAGEEFDLIVTNPPFVITPQSLREHATLTYRDGGAAGDAISRAVITGAREHLAPGGRLFALVNWMVRKGQSWEAPLREWFSESGLAAWGILRQLQTPAEYAQTWLTDAGLHPGTPEFEAGMDAYLEYFAAENVTAIAFGYITLRNSRPFQRIEDGRDGIAPSGQAADDFWDAVDLVDSIGFLGVEDAASEPGTGLETFLSQRFQVAPDVIEERYYTPGADDPQLIRLAQRASLARTIQVDTYTAACVGAANGELTLGQLLNAIAALMQAPAAEVIAQSAPLLRELVLCGFLLPAD